MSGSVADRDKAAQEQRTARLSVAALRRAVPIKMWGGKGCGAACDFCRVVVSPSDVEYEIEAELDSQKLTLHFHPRCHDAWMSDREAGPDAAAGEPEIPLKQAAGSGQT